MRVPVRVWPSHPPTGGGAAGWEETMRHREAHGHALRHATNRDGRRVAHGRRTVCVGSVPSSRYASNRYRRESGFSRRQMTLSITGWWMPMNVQPMKKKSVAPKTARS